MVIRNASFSGEITSVGTPTKNITWDIIGTSQVFDLDYGTDNGNTWHRIVNDYRQTGSTGSYSWQVPNVPTTQALVRVGRQWNRWYVDQSDAPFTITGADPVIIAISPSRGYLLIRMTIRLL